MGAGKVRAGWHHPRGPGDGDMGELAGWRGGTGPGGMQGLWAPPWAEEGKGLGGSTAIIPHPRHTAAGLPGRRISQFQMRWRAEVCRAGQRRWHSSHAGTGPQGGPARLSRASQCVPVQQRGSATAGSGLAAGWTWPGTGSRQHSRLCSFPAAPGHLATPHSPPRMRGP